MQLNYILIKPTKPATIKRKFVKDFSNLKNKGRSVFFVSALRQLTGDYLCRLDIFDDKLQEKIFSHAQLFNTKLEAIAYLRTPLQMFNCKHRDVFIYDADSNVNDLTEKAYRWIKNQI